MNAETNAEIAELVDAHCHVDLYGKDETAVISLIETQRVHTIAVTNAPSVYFHTRDVAQKHCFLYSAIGLHPELASERGQELDQMWKYLAETCFVGEVGLDYTTASQENHRHQRRIFSQILEKCAYMGNKVISVHSRMAATDVISAIGPSFPASIILHWFTGNYVQLDQAIQNGYWFSVNPAMLWSQSARKLIERMPRERVLTETDGPFVSVNGKPARATHIVDVVRSLAQIWNVSSEEATRIIFRNFSSVTKEINRPS